MADVTIVNKFPKSVFTRADVEAERTVRLSIKGVKSSVITDDGDHWTLTTVFPQVAAKGAGQQSGGPAGNTSTIIVGAPGKERQTAFGSLVAGGFFSADPTDMSVPRSIRCNNPGALNFSDWQAARPGFAGQSQPDGSSNHNITAVYFTPEHGVGSWFHLLDDRYGLGAGGSFSIQTLARRYAGADSGSLFESLISGWVALSRGTLTRNSVIDITDDDAMLGLAKAMFHNEAGRPTPLHDDQIMFALRHERAGTLPA